MIRKIPRVLGRDEIPGTDAHAGADVGRSWELCCSDPGRKRLPGFDAAVARGRTMSPAW